MIGIFILSSLCTIVFGDSMLSQPQGFTLVWIFSDRYYKTACFCQLLYCIFSKPSADCWNSFDGCHTHARYESTMRIVDPDDKTKFKTIPYTYIETDPAAYPLDYFERKSSGRKTATVNAVEEPSNEVTQSSVQTSTSTDSVSDTSISVAKRNPNTAARVRILLRSLPKRSQGFTIPRSSLMVSGRGFGPGFADYSTGIFHLTKRGVSKNNAEEMKRSITDDNKELVPRSGLMVSGRGYMPGFFSVNPKFFVKRSSPVDYQETPYEDIQQENPPFFNPLKQFGLY